MKGKRLKNENERSRLFWFHIWNGLVLDSKHEEKLGKSVWLYLWLLAKVDRQTGEVLITVSEIAKQRNLSVPGVRWRMNVLKSQRYITTDDMGYCTKIKITKWRSINGKKKGWIPEK
jgi:hypothetical protein